MFGHTTERPEFDEPTTDLFMDKILDYKECKKHDARLGEPCFLIIDKNGFGTRAVCNRRAIHSGYNARISRGSLVRNHIKKNWKGN